MSLKVSYKVHGARPARVSKNAVVDGIEMAAEVDGFIVELVPTQQGASAIQLHFTKPDEVKAAKEVFHDGAVFTWVIA